MSGAEGTAETFSVEGFDGVESGGEGELVEFNGSGSVTSDVISSGLWIANDANIDYVAALGTPVPQFAEGFVRHILGIEGDVEMRVPFGGVGVVGNLKKVYAAAYVVFEEFGTAKFGERRSEVSNLVKKWRGGMLEGESEELGAICFLEPDFRLLRYDTAEGVRAERTPSEAAGITEDLDNAKVFVPSKPCLAFAGQEPFSAFRVFVEVEGFINLVNTLE